MLQLYGAAQGFVALRVVPLSYQDRKGLIWPITEGFYVRVHIRFIIALIITPEALFVP